MFYCCVRMLHSHWRPYLLFQITLHRKMAKKSKKKRKRKKLSSSSEEDEKVRMHSVFTCC